MLEADHPYMKYTKTYENGKLTWKRERKTSPSSDEVKKIASMSTEKAKKLPTEDKLIWLYSIFENIKREVGRNLNQNSSAPIMILVERSHFLRDSFEQFRTTTNLDLRRRIKIHFMDEICQDVGGLIRDWFSVLIEELFAPSFGLFVKTNTDDITYTINTFSEKAHANHLEYYYFCGQILSKALYERITIKAYLAKFLLKWLINIEVTFDDLKYFDKEIWKSMNYIKNNKLEGEIGNFVISQKNPLTNSVEQKELKPEGSNIPINEDTKAEFIELSYKYYLIESIGSQFTELVLGFFSLIPGNIISILDFEELEFFLCGEQEISLKDWEENTKYRGTYNKDHPVIKWFWTILSNLNKLDLEKFLQFCTGSTRAPAEGFSGLTSNGNICLFTIDSTDYNNDGTDFPVAHTCFNKLELPIYPTMDELDKVIRTIVSNPLCYQFSSE